MKTFEEKFTAWIDGRLAGRELDKFEAELAKTGNAAAGSLCPVGPGQAKTAGPAPARLAMSASGIRESADPDTEDHLETRTATRTVSTSESGSRPSQP